MHQREGLSLLGCRKEGFGVMLFDRVHSTPLVERAGDTKPTYAERCRQGPSHPLSGFAPEFRSMRFVRLDLRHVAQTVVSAIELFSSGCCFLRQNWLR